MRITHHHTRTFTPCVPTSTDAPLESMTGSYFTPKISHHFSQFLTIPHHSSPLLTTPHHSSPFLTHSLFYSASITTCVHTYQYSMWELSRYYDIHGCRRAYSISGKETDCWSPTSRLSLSYPDVLCPELFAILYSHLLRPSLSPATPKSSQLQCSSVRL